MRDSEMNHRYVKTLFSALLYVELSSICCDITVLMDWLALGTKTVSGKSGKYQALSPQTQLESVPASHPERHIQWFHAYKC